MASSRFVTKLFNSEDPVVRRSIFGGSIKFGSLEEYREQESAVLSRLTDSEDGIYVEQVNKSTFTTGILGHVACMVDGRYDVEKAQRIIANGNSDLDAYVTYDLDRLLKAITFAIRKDKSIPETRRLEIRPFGASINYLEKNGTISLEDVPPPQGISSGDLSARVVFAKDVHFQHESEYRIWLIGYPSRISKEPYFVASFGTKRAIIAKGKI